MTTMSQIDALFDEIRSTHGNPKLVIPLVYSWHTKFFDRPDELELQIALLTAIFPFRTAIPLTYYAVWIAVRNLLNSRGHDAAATLRGLEP